MKKKPIPKWKDPNWNYVPSSQTDVLKRFKAMGWKAPSEKN